MGSLSKTNSPAAEQQQKEASKAQPLDSAFWDFGGYGSPDWVHKNHPISADSARDIALPGKVALRLERMLLIEADMNVPSNLEFYRQVVELEHNVSTDAIRFYNLDHSQQRALQSIAHSRKLEYEYHSRCARVFRRTAPLSLSFQNPPSDLGLAPISESVNHPFLRHIRGRHTSLTGAVPQSSRLQEAAFSSSMADDHPSLPAWDSMEMPTYSGQLGPQSTVAADCATPNVDSSSTIQPPGPTFSSPFMDFSSIQQQNGAPSSQSFQQQADLMFNLAMGSTQSVDETGTLFGSMYPGIATFDLEPFSDSRRMSGTSFAVSNMGDLTADICEYESFSTALPETSVHNYDYPPPSRASRGSSFTSATPLSPAPQNRSGFQSRKPTSRSGSVSSLQSERGRNRISKIFKRSSSTNLYSTGMEEIVFDSNQARSSSQASSGRGRTGPLDYLARAGMKAVKAIGDACWRCRILGKRVRFRNEA
jgi:hypothetical protein